MSYCILCDRQFHAPGGGSFPGPCPYCGQPLQGQIPAAPPVVFSNDAAFQARVTQFVPLNRGARRGKC